MIPIVGGGPAGSAAALAAIGEGARVRVYEKSAFPRQKVCGEFVSPEAEDVLRALGAWEPVAALAPHSIREVRLHFGARQKRWTLDRPAISISRLALDHALSELAVARGAEWIRETAPCLPRAILAHGRKSSAAKGRRLFGYKARFTGPVDDAVDLFFFDRGYTGVSAVEGGITNVCGLAPEDKLRAVNFDIDAYLAPLGERLRPLARQIDWLITGPLVFTDSVPATSDAYLAGDALGFIDPFTGSGITAALVTGRIAGQSAARGLTPRAHLDLCRAALRWQYRTAGIFRAAIESGWAQVLAPWMPGSLLFRLTRL